MSWGRREGPVPFCPVVPHAGYPWEGARCSCPSKRKGRQIECELRNFGERGVEVHFLSDREPFYGLRLSTYELALKWAETERRAWGWMDADAAPSSEMALVRA